MTKMTKPLEAADQIFTSPVEFVENSVLDRHQRKPDGRDDQGHKDENP